MKKWNRTMGSTHIIMLSFFLAIVLGSFLLWLPISHARGAEVSYLDALFTSTTATCVTGLVTLPTVTTWSIFGQVVILILIQIGGLGVVTIMSGIMIAFHKKMGMGDRLLLQNAFNLNSLSGLIRFVKKVIKGTFLVEGIGALIYMTVFIPEFGLRGIWISVFNSVSAFCNAGIDIIAPNSLCDYAVNPVINIVTSLLIIAGGIGYVVWWDLIRISKLFGKKGFRCFENLNLGSKIAIYMTVLLIIGGGLGFFIFEYNNPLTIGNLPFFQKIEVSFFQSVTTRTAGFATVDQQNLTNSSAILSLLLMFIGGSPVGTAGGVKTVTVAVLLISAFATIKNNEEANAFDRNISNEAIKKSISVISMSFIIMFASTLLLSACTDAAVIDVLYETVSATATVGLTRNLTSSLNVWGKIIIIVTMYLGRIGPISLAMAFNIKSNSGNVIKNPTEEISVG